jgi:hypothetical protein
MTGFRTPRCHVPAGAARRAADPVKVHVSTPKRLRPPPAGGAAA